MVKKLLLLLGLTTACAAQTFKVDQLVITGLTPGTTALCVPSAPGQVTNVGCAGTSGAAGGALAGFYPNPTLADPVPGNLNSTQYFQDPLYTPGIGTTFQVDGFPTDGGSYAGAYDAGTHYNLWATVTYAGVDWINVAGSGLIGVTPSTPAAGETIFWIQFDSSGAGLSACQADDAFFWAFKQAQFNSATAGFNSNSSVDLNFGTLLGGYCKNGDWVQPTNQYGYAIQLHGRGRGATWINQTTSTLNYMLSSPNVSSSEGQIVDGITFNANLLAGGCLSEHNRRSYVHDVACFNPQQQPSGTINAAMYAGQSGDMYESTWDNVLVRTASYPGIVYAYGTASISGGSISGITFTGTGTDLNLPVAAGPGLYTYFIGKGAGGFPCTTMPGQPTYTLTSGSITGTTLGTTGSGCAGTIYVLVVSAGTIPYGYYFGATDSTFKDIVTSGDFTAACEIDYHGANTYIHEHPYCGAPYQIWANGGGSQQNGDTHISTELDTPRQYGVYVTGNGEIFKSYSESWPSSSGVYAGAGNFLIDSAATHFAIESGICLANQTNGGYAKFTGSTAGIITTANAASVLLSTGTVDGMQPNCDGSNGVWGNYLPGVVTTDITAPANLVQIDDFMSFGTGLSGTVGALGWNIGTIAAGSLSGGLNASEMSANHPGVIASYGSALSGEGSYLSLGNIANLNSPIATTGWNMQWISTVNTYLTMSWREGWMSAVPSGGNGTIVNGTYTSGITATGTTGQTCTLTSFNNSSTATATVALTGTNTIAGSTALVITSKGTGATAAATSAIAGNGTATCSGTATIATVQGVNPYSASGYYFRFDTTLSDTNIMACVDNASTETCSSTGQAPATTTWHDYFISSTTTGTVNFQVDTGSVITACASGCTISTTMPTTAMQPIATNLTWTNGNVIPYYDYFKLVQAGLTR